LRLALYVNRYSMERLSSDSVLLSRLIDRAKEMGFQRLYLETTGTAPRSGLR
jgi:N-acetylglutamate synthase-like GNAT family acetyltransferase